jgi:hypothetical protein
VQCVEALTPGTLLLLRSGTTLIHYLFFITEFKENALLRLDDCVFVVTNKENVNEIIIKKTTHSKGEKKIFFSKSIAVPSGL